MWLIWPATWGFRFKWFQGYRLRTCCKATCGLDVGARQPGQANPSTPPGRLVLLQIRHAQPNWPEKLPARHVHKPRAAWPVKQQSGTP